MTFSKTKTEPAPTLRAALYGRVSTDEQVKSHISLDAQKEKLEALATIEGWQIAGFYIDEGISGGTDKRPQLQNLMLDAKLGKFDLVAVTKIDRFFRNTRLLLDYIHTLDGCGVAFVAHTEGINTRDKGIGHVILALLAAIAEWERERIGERVSDYRTHLSAKGQWSSGRTLFGYHFDKITKQLVVNDIEAEAVRYIFSEYTHMEKSIGILKLAERMNETSFLPPRAVRKTQKMVCWTQTNIQHILKHHAYQGAPNDHYKFKVPAIVTPEVWAEAQKRLASNKHIKPSIEQKTPYQGHLVCGVCGRTLRIGYNYNRAMVYECPGRWKMHHLDGSDHCTLPRFPTKIVDTSLSAEIKKILSDPTVLKKNLEASLSNLKADLTNAEVKIKPLSDEIAQVQENMTILDTRLEMHRIDTVSYKNRMSKLQAQDQDLKKRTELIDPSAHTDLEEKHQAIEIFETMLKFVETPRTAKLMLGLTDKWISHTKGATFTTGAMAINNFMLALKGAEGNMGEGMIGIVHPDKRIELRLIGNNKFNLQTK